MAPSERNFNHPGAASAEILSVSDLNRQARLTVEERFGIVWVMGELSNFARPRSGHWYFTLKDDNAQVRCAMFANRNRTVQLQPAEGQSVLIRGRVSLYEGRGDFQVLADYMEPAGEGALRQAFDRLKVKLHAEGLFDADRKQPVPRMPAHIAIVTSPTGAAIADVLAVLSRRHPLLEVTVVPSAVQGEQAEGELIAALAAADRLEADAILLTRGGGSLEDLWAFNLEAVARAVAGTSTPVVCAVGHEIDTSICDFVADARAPTPSAAAELLSPDFDDVLGALRSYERRLAQLTRLALRREALKVENLMLQLTDPQQLLAHAMQRTDDMAARMQNAMRHHLRAARASHTATTGRLRQQDPARRIAGTRDRLTALQHRNVTSMSSALRRAEQRLTNTGRMLHSLSPLPTRARGYAVLTDDNDEVVTSVEQTAPDATLSARLHDGRLTLRVQARAPIHDNDLLTEDLRDD